MKNGHSYRIVCQTEKPSFHLNNKEIVLPKRLLLGFPLNVFFLNIFN